MTALWISGATCVITLGGGLMALRLQAYRGLVLAFCAGALVAGALLEVIPEALQLLESTHSRFHHHHLLFACSLGFLCFYLFEHTAHHSDTQDHPSHYNHTCQAGAWGAAGIGVHSFFDGFAIGGAFQAGGEVGWVVALAVTALAPIAGVLAQSTVAVPIPLLALTLGWFAGVFLYLGASSLLPAAHESGHSRWLPLATLAGVAVIYLAQRLAE